IFKIKFQLRRNSYRTISFIRTLRKNIFGHTKITDNRNNNVDVVFNTTELRTGTAFRFSSKNSGNWRFGLIKDNDIEIAEAVALSAAYPLFLPSSDKNFDFVKNKHTKRKRVVLSDGGIYDNIGVSCMEPGKNPTYSTVIFKPEYIIACNAGYGMLTGDFIPFGLITRFKQIFLTTMRKVQDATMHRLHIYKETNKIKGFVLPYLGQLDQYLPYKWPDLVKRQDVDYPTDFRPMKVKDIELLSKRGEQLTRLLLEHYCPTL
ncbi:MAG: patatin, partial [Planctomycetia bacterium]|nr:patatin [Planctomycetia bacterium]